MPSFANCESRLQAAGGYDTPWTLGSRVHQHTRRETLSPVPPVTWAYESADRLPRGDERYLTSGIVWATRWARDGIARRWRGYVMFLLERRRVAKASRRSGSSVARWSGPSRVTMWCGLGIGLGFYLVFGIAPAVGTVLVSLTNYSGLPGSPTAFTGISQYTGLTTTEGPGFLPAIVATIVFVVVGVLLQFVVSLALAHGLRRRGRGSNFLRTLVFMPIVLGVTVVGILWLLIFDPSQGPAASAFALVGKQSSFFGSNTLAMPLVIFTQIWMNLGFAMLVFIGGLNSIGAEIYDAAHIDGVGAWTRFRNLTLPLIAPSITVVVLLGVIGQFTTYNIIYVLTDGLYGTMTLGMLAFNSAFGGSANLGYGAAVSVVLFAMTLVVALPVQYALRRHQRRVFE